MAFKLSATLRNYIVNDVISNYFFGMDSGVKVYIYNGTIPASADHTTSGTMLAALGTTSTGATGYNIISFGLSTDGSAGLSYPVYGTALSSGTATYARLEYRDGTYGTYTLQGEVGTAATCIFRISNAELSADQFITLSDIFLRQPAG